ncbi:MAG: hypothetical protein AB1439_07145 [candidate division FCPU426 bacterium]
MSEETTEILKEILVPLITSGLVPLIISVVVSAFISWWFNKIEEKRRRTFDIRYQKYTETLGVFEEINILLEESTKKSSQGISGMISRILKGENVEAVLEDFSGNYLVSSLIETNRLINKLNNSFSKLKIICSQELYETIDEYIRSMKKVIDKTPEWSKKLIENKIAQNVILDDPDSIKVKLLNEKIPLLMRKDMKRYLDK